MRVALLMLLSGIAFADCSVGDVLVTLRPGAQWNLRGETYNGLEWLDQSQPKPTQTEVAIATTTCAANKIARDASKIAARATLNNPASPDRIRIDAIVTLLDLDSRLSTQVLRSSGTR